MPIFNEKGEEIKVTSSKSEEGGKAQEPAAPAEPDESKAEGAVTESEPDDTDGEEPTGGKAQEVAASAARTPEFPSRRKNSEPFEKLSRSPSAEPAEPNQSKDGQHRVSAERTPENRKQAAARRARELEDVKASVQSEMLQSLELVDPATGKRVETPEEYRDYLSHRDGKRAEEQLRRAGIDPDIIKNALTDSGVAKAADDAIAAAGAAEKRANEQAERLSLEEAIAEITRLNPEVKTFDDLYALPEYGDVKKLVGAGYSFGRAYEMATVDRAKSAARQASYNAVASKAHLTRTAGVGTEPYSISDKDFNNFRQLHPNATRAEAEAAFKKFGHKKGK